MKLIVGLGNPGNTYAGSRHNIGFEVIDELLDRHGLKLSDQKFRADFTIWHNPHSKAILMEPFTYMNLSGEAVLPMMSYYGIDADDLLVIHDDLDLEPGRLRLRLKGSSGGQKGLQNIIDMLGTQEIKRIKLGIGRPKGGWKVTDHVLAPFTAEEWDKVNEQVGRAADAIEEWLAGTSFEKLMTNYH